MPSLTCPLSALPPPASRGGGGGGGGGRFGRVHVGHPVLLGVLSAGVLIGGYFFAKSGRYGHARNGGNKKFSRAGKIHEKGESFSQQDVIIVRIVCTCTLRPICSRELLAIRRAEKTGLDNLDKLK